eukprot:g3630.t1
MTSHVNNDIGRSNIPFGNPSSRNVVSSAKVLDSKKLERAALNTDLAYFAQQFRRVPVRPLRSSGTASSRENTDFAFGISRARNTRKSRRQKTRKKQRGGKGGSKEKGTRPATANNIENGNNPRIKERAHASVTLERPQTSDGRTVREQESKKRNDEPSSLLRVPQNVDYSNSSLSPRETREISKLVHIISQLKLKNENDALRYKEMIYNLERANQTERVRKAKVDMRLQEELARKKKRVENLELALKQVRKEKKEIITKVRNERVIIQGELQDMRVTLESLKCENKKMAKKLLEQQQQQRELEEKARLVQQSQQQIQGTPSRHHHNHNVKGTSSFSPPFGDEQNFTEEMSRNDPHYPPSSPLTDAKQQEQKGGGKATREKRVLARIKAQLDCVALEKDNSKLHHLLSVAHDEQTRLKDIIGEMKKKLRNLRKEKTAILSMQRKRESFATILAKKNIGGTAPHRPNTAPVSKKGKRYVRGGKKRPMSQKGKKKNTNTTRNKNNRTVDNVNVSSNTIAIKEEGEEPAPPQEETVARLEEKETQQETVGLKEERKGTTKDKEEETVVELKEALPTQAAESKVEHEKSEDSLKNKME